MLKKIFKIFLTILTTLLIIVGIIMFACLIKTLSQFLFFNVLFKIFVTFCVVFFSTMIGILANKIVEKLFWEYRKYKMLKKGK